MKSLLICAAASLMLVSACSQPEPEVYVAPEPVYDKYGNEIDGGGCTGGTAGANNPCYPGDDFIPEQTQDGGGGSDGTADQS